MATKNMTFPFVILKDDKSFFPRGCGDVSTIIYGGAPLITQQGNIQIILKAILSDYHI